METAQSCRWKELGGKYRRAPASAPTPLMSRWLLKLSKEGTAQPQGSGTHVVTFLIGEAEIKGTEVTDEVKV